MKPKFLGKLIVPEILKDLSTFYAPRRFITVFAKARRFFLSWDMYFKPHSSVLVSSYQQHPDIPNGPSSSNCSTKTLRVFLISPTHFTRHAHLLISADHAAAPRSASGAVGKPLSTGCCVPMSVDMQSDKPRSRRLMSLELLCLQWFPQYSVCDLWHVFLLLQILFLVGALRNVRWRVSLWHQVRSQHLAHSLCWQLSDRQCCRPTVQQHCK